MKANYKKQKKLLSHGSHSILNMADRALVANAEESTFSVFPKAKKSLGQNFLKSQLALRKIIEAGEIKPTDIILEIGPGKGMLTTKLLEHAKLVVAVEKDRELFEFLKKKFEKEIVANTLVLVCEDILKFDLSETVLKFFSGPRNSPSLSQPDHEKNLNPFRYKIIANIPYNITGAILKKFLTEKHQPDSMVLMVQHEVARRIVAQDGKESILSISVKAYGKPKIVMKVPARYFSPAPKVDSAVIAIKDISRDMFEKNQINEQRFWEIVKTGFAHKRKKLSSNLKNLKNGSKASVLDVSSSQGLSLRGLGNKRAEDLTLSGWITLCISC